LKIHVSELWREQRSYIKSSFHCIICTYNSFVRSNFSFSNKNIRKLFKANLIVNRLFILSALIPIYFKIEPSINSTAKKRVLWKLTKDWVISKYIYCLIIGTKRFVKGYKRKGPAKGIQFCVALFCEKQNTVCSKIQKCIKTTKCFCNCEIFARLIEIIHETVTYVFSLQTYIFSFKMYIFGLKMYIFGLKTYIFSLKTYVLNETNKTRTVSIVLNVLNISNIQLRLQNAGP